MEYKSHKMNPLNLLHALYIDLLRIIYDVYSLKH